MLKNTIWFLIGIILIVNVNADFEWMYLRKYGSNVTLKPLAPLDKNDTILTTFIKSECRWLLPDFKTYLWPNVVNTDAKSRYKINLNDCSLEITSINEEDNGIYHVFLNGTDTNENGTYVTKAMLNYHGPPYDSFIDEYRYNLIAGFSTFGGMYKNSKTTKKLKTSL